MTARPPTPSLLSLIVLCRPHREVDGVKWVDLRRQISFQVQYPRDLFTWMLTKVGLRLNFLTHLDDTTHHATTTTTTITATTSRR